jgi:hypothetical protein
MMPPEDDDPWTIMDWIDAVNSDPDVDPEDDDDTATEWDEMADWDLEDDDEEEDDHL